ncbi:MAG: hypothetical protein HW387_604 [Parachlamydiales bacterium]|nr:hypothetical protein [Parachlamydiales bacterium]
MKLENLKKPFTDFFTDVADACNKKGDLVEQNKRIHSIALRIVGVLAALIVMPLVFSAGASLISGCAAAFTITIIGAAILGILAHDSFQTSHNIFPHNEGLEAATESIEKLFTSDKNKDPFKKTILFKLVCSILSHLIWTERKSE